ncbi:MAG: PKHD-type hydroxylase [Rhodospirillales bacterium]|jgi:PKHD-type hydroxylase|nr:PKHD-type hydroxylase [Rhodospirillales bacterium]
MILNIPGVLTTEQLAQARRLLGGAAWIDGSVTAGYQAVKVKHNLQIPEDHPAARELGALVLGALERNPVFLSAALPVKVYPPMFNRYDPGQTFGTHVDTAIRYVPETPHRVRTDLSATLFLTPPAEYDGGELVIEDTYGTHSVKLGAGDMILYPGSSLHQVLPVTRGTRLASFFWIQSMVRADADRALLYELDTAIQQLAGVTQNDASVVRLTNVYHNLIRRWAEV